jgi:hypothetical protein
MVKAVATFGLAFLFLAGCGGGSGNTGDGGVTSSSSCNLSCLVQATKMMESCIPSGTCVFQKTSTGGAMCFSNGVKGSVLVTSTSSSSSSATITFKQNSRICFSMVVTTTDTASGGDTSTTTFKNAEGGAVATISSGDGMEPTVACPGKAASPLDPTCETESSSVGGANWGGTGDCTEGSCSF